MVYLYLIPRLTWGVWCICMSRVSVSVYCVVSPGNQSKTLTSLSLSPHSVLAMEVAKLEDTEAGVEYNEEAIHQRIEDLCQCIEEKQRLVKLKREELRK